MKFRILGDDRRIPDGGKNEAILVTDRWDDWGKYRKQFYLVVFDNMGNKHEPGNVKIGQIGLKPGG